MKILLAKVLTIIMVLSLFTSTFSTISVSASMQNVGMVRLEAESAQLAGSAKKYSYPAASNGKIVLYIDKIGNSITFKSTVKASGIIVGYARGLTGDGQLSLYINDVNSEDISFPNTGGWGTKSTDYKECSFDCDIPANSNIKFQFDSGDIPVNIDYIDLNTNKAAIVGKSEAAPITTLIPGKRYTVNNASQFRELITCAHQNFDDKLLLTIPDYDAEVYRTSIVTDIIYENPNLNYGYLGAQSKTIWDGYSRSRDINITFEYSKTKNEMLLMKKAVEAKAEEIVKSIITPGMRDYEKELKIYDYIINNTKYDSVALTKVVDEAHTDYGVLILGKGVCEGYSRAAYRLLNMAGVKTTLISGYTNGVTHQWNIVYLDGKPYHLDATSDDPITANGSDLLKHDFFNVTDSAMRDTHKWDAKGYPVCNSTDYSYTNVLDYIKNIKNPPALTPIVTTEPTPVLQPTPVLTATPAPAATASSTKSKNVTIESDRIAWVTFKKTDKDTDTRTDTISINTIAADGITTFDYKDFSLKNGKTASAANLLYVQPCAIGSTKAGTTTLTIKVTKKNGAMSGVLWYKDKPVDGLIFIIKKLE